MYTEICHYLLFYTILYACGCFTNLVPFTQLKKTKKKQNPVVFTKKIQKEKKEQIIQKRFQNLWFHTQANSSSLRSANCWIKESTIPKILFSSFFLLLSVSFFGTINNYICSDFSIYNTTTNSTADIPIFYKISATWSNHEGSLLLWSWLLSFSAFLFSMTLESTKIDSFSKIHFDPLEKHFQFRLLKRAPGHHNESIRKSFYSYTSRITNYKFSSLSQFSILPIYRFSKNLVFQKNKKFNLISEKRIYKFKPQLNKWNWKKLFRSTSTLVLDKTPVLKLNFIKKKAIFITKIILLFFITFCIMTSNPFLRTSNPSINSLAELNPILQDPILAIHPPCIYVGYVASGIAFSLCVGIPICLKFSSMLNKKK